jgi:wyosine [tRNA(Phe)-imidazoG37] synthetase (radical SAM superfamily)
MYAFGPVPSRRLGRSLGMSNVPAKHCSYSCIYCQLGGGYKTSCARQEFGSPDEIVREVEACLERALRSGEQIDYPTFVTDGEPTSDANLGRMIRRFNDTGVGTAVIANEVCG